MKLKVFCAHEDRDQRDGNDCLWYTCKTCGRKWHSQEDEPKVLIGYVEEVQK